jgi:hypothetical protein
MRRGKTRRPRKIEARERDTAGFQSCRQRCRTGKADDMLRHAAGGERGGELRQHGLGAADAET